MEEELKSLKMIVFDVDGTLADTDDHYIEKSAVILRKILPFVSLENMVKITRPFIMAGETILHSCYRLLDTVGLDRLITRIHNRISVHHEYKYREIEGMRETLGLLACYYVLGIVTSGGSKSTDSFLEKFDLKQIISYVVTAEDCQFIKPHPMPLIKIASDAGIPINNCMLVGDTIFDILCAKRAGAVACAVKSGFDSEKFLNTHRPFILLESVKELPDFLGIFETKIKKCS